MNDIAVPDSRGHGSRPAAIAGRDWDAHTRGSELFASTRRRYRTLLLASPRDDWEALANGPARPLVPYVGTSRHRCRRSRITVYRSRPATRASCRRTRGAARRYLTVRMKQNSGQPDENSTSDQGRHGRDASTGLQTAFARDDDLLERKGRRSRTDGRERALHGRAMSPQGLVELRTTRPTFYRATTCCRDGQLPPRSIGIAGGAAGRRGDVPRTRSRLSARAAQEATGPFARLVYSGGWRS